MGKYGEKLYKHGSGVYFNEPDYFLENWKVGCYFDEEVQNYNTPGQFLMSQTLICIWTLLFSTKALHSAL